MIPYVSRSSGPVLRGVLFGRVIKIMKRGVFLNFFSLTILPMTRTRKTPR